MPTTEVFEELRRYPIDSLNVEFQEYRHLKTGARHFHLAADDDQNAFLVAFLTVPQDSTGVAHILEHTVLCGSKNYPVRDPFFMMLRRSLNTFMNAFTASDWTAYPFASRNRKDYFNLLDIYLDATFFPNLNELDFRQEGHRLDFSEPGNRNSPLMYKGVVFNEMKGAYSSPNARLMKLFSKSLYPTITYHHDSGGDPAFIPDLTWQQLKDFHALHYHPSNAVIVTYGDLPAEDLQQRFEQRALNEFSAIDVSSLAIPDETRFDAPQQVSSRYPLAEEDTSNRTHVALGWLLGRNADIRKVLEARVMTDVLLDNSSSPLRHALEISDLGAAPSPLCGLDEDTREMSFSVGLEGTDVEKADEVEHLILGVLQDVAEKGVPTESVLSVLHQLELSQREITGDGFPYGLQLALRTLTPALHGGDPVSSLDFDNILGDLRSDAEDPSFIPRLIKELLLDNNHRVRLVMAPDTQLAANEEADEAKHLARLTAELDDRKREELARLADELEKRQAQEDDPELLPRVTLEDVPQELKFPEGKSESIGTLPAVWYHPGTNGMVYQQLVCDLPAFNGDEIDILPLYAMCIAELGSGGRDYMATQALQASVLGGIGARISTRSVLGDTENLHASMVLSAKGLSRNAGHISSLLNETFDSPDFSEALRIKDLISQVRIRRESSITGRGHALAMAAASSHTSVSAALSHRWSGLQSIASIKAIDDRIQAEPDYIAELAARMNSIHDRMKSVPRNLLIVSDEDQKSAVLAALHASGLVEKQDARNNKDPAFTVSYEQRQVQQAWSTNAQVNYCGQSHVAVPAGHDDAPALTVLGEFLGHGFLHSTIREKGGAYGGGASFDGESSAFRFYSYRDPRLEETFADFDASVRWLLNTSHEPRALEEAILSVISRIDKPGSPAGEAISHYYAERYGRGTDYVQNIRKKVLAVTLNDLRQVGAKYLNGAEVSKAVVGSPEKMNSLDGFEQFNV